MIYKAWLASKVISNEDKDRINKMTKIEKAEAFNGCLNFGTAGLRGIMDVGTNRMNTYVIAQVSQAIANFMNDKNQKNVVIACDTRNNSELFKNTAVNVFLLNNLNVFIFDSVVPLALLSYAVRKLKCDFGIYITASHNPKEYNGYKVFDKTGCQINEKVADIISSYRDDVDILSEYQKSERTPTIIDNSLFKSFAKEIKKAKVHDVNNLNITYTGLYGTGNWFVDRALMEFGFDVHVVKEESVYNGDFPELPTPNPEDEAAFKKALIVAEENKSDIIIGTDPDADRIGVLVRHHNQYIKLTGNQVGILLANYFTKYKKVKKPCVILSDVSTNMVREICKKNKAEVITVSTGFKNIGAKINTNKHDFLLGFEESCGYLVGPYIKDKDAIGASVLVAEMAAFYKTKKMTLIDELDKLYKKHGYFMEKTISIPVNDKVSLFDIVGIVTDGSLSISNLTLKDNIFHFDMKNKCSLTFRRSGTEPKMKIYIKVVSPSETESLELMERYCVLAETVRENIGGKNVKNK